MCTDPDDDSFVLSTHLSTFDPRWFRGTDCPRLRAQLVNLQAFGCMTVYAPVDEQPSKHIQLVSGVSYRVYWLAYWLSDYAIAMYVQSFSGSPKIHRTRSPRGSILVAVYSLRQRC
jgi:hypothetical protein